MTETTCKREIELEIPAENVQKATEKVARDIARVARIPGFRPGKAPVTLIRRRFAEDIEGEVVQSLVPEYLEKALDEKKLVPVTRPEVDKVEFKEGEPLKFRAVFEVLPEFELGDYKNLTIQVDAIEVGDAQVDKTHRGNARARRDLRSRRRPRGAGWRLRSHQTDRARREGGGEPVQGRQHSLPHWRRRNARKLHGKSSRRIAGETKQFQAHYPDDYPDPKLAGKAYDYSVEVQGIKEKKLPELNDEFAKDAAGEMAASRRSTSCAGKSARTSTPRKEQQQAPGARENSAEAREAARFPRSRSADRASNGCAAGTRGAVAGRARR